MDAQSASMHNTVPMAGKTPEMKIAVDSLASEVERLQATVSVLSARLGPLLNAGTPQEVRADIQQMDAEYPAKVNNYAYALADQTSMLDQLISRLEV